MRATNIRAINWSIHYLKCSKMWFPSNTKIQWHSDRFLKTFSREIVFGFFVFGSAFSSSKRYVIWLRPPIDVHQLSFWSSHQKYHPQIVIRKRVAWKLSTSTSSICCFRRSISLNLVLRLTSISSDNYEKLNWAYSRLKWDFHFFSKESVEGQFFPLLFFIGNPVLQLLYWVSAAYNVLNVNLRRSKGSSYGMGHLERASRLYGLDFNRMEK